MNTETLARTALGRVYVKVVAAGMESRLRYRFFGAEEILAGAEIAPGQRILEVGCGTGYFTIPAARILGPQGALVALDILQESVDLVTRKVREATLTNVRVVKGDALNTAEPAASFDAALLFGIVPAPMVPLRQLLSEMHRVLKPGGTLCVWPHVPLWLPEAVARTGLFRHSSRQNGVDNFTRC